VGVCVQVYGRARACWKKHS